MALDIFTISEKKFKINKMENRLCEKELFQSNFDSFEFDDGFLSKVDSEVKKNNMNLKKNFKIQNGFISEPKNKFLGTIEKDLKKENYYDLSINIEDLNDSDFNNISVEGKNKGSLKIPECSAMKRKGSDLSNSDFLACLSPIHGEMSSKDRNSSFSSTPLREKSSTETSKNKPTELTRTSQNMKENGTELEGVELDLFEDWDIEDFNSNEIQSNKGSLITLSQAVDLIEEAKLAKESEEQSQDDALNKSINLLTGEIGGNFDNLFDESFDPSKLKSDKKGDTTLGLEKSFSMAFELEKGIEELNSEPKNKSLVAQKLNFETNNINEATGDSGGTTEKKENYCGDFENIYFSSDDDFDVFSHFDEPNKFTKLKLNMETSKDQLKTSNNEIKIETPRERDIIVELDDSSFLMGKKRKKYFKVIESDTAEESPSPKSFRIRKNKKKSKMCNKTPQTTSGRGFIDLEAEVSECDEVSSDENQLDKDDEYEKSFVDEGSYFSQNYSVDMTAKYLQSANAVSNRPGTFKIPEMKPYDPADICSQFLPNTSTDYEIDSFCVNDVEYEETDLSELEVAEQILEMDRRNRKKKCGAPDFKRRW